MGLFNLFETPEEKERKRIADQIAFLSSQQGTQSINYVGGDPLPPLERPKPWDVERAPLWQQAAQPAPAPVAAPWQAPMPWRFNPEKNDVELLRGGEGTPGTAGTQGTPAGNQTIGHLPSSFDVQMQRERERAQVPLAPSQPAPTGQPLQINGRTFVQNPRQTQADFDRQMAANVIRQVRPDGTVSNVGFAGKSVLEAGNPQANAQAQQDYWKQAAGTNSAMRRMGVGVTKENQARLLEGDVAAAQKQERELAAISAVTGVQNKKAAEAEAQRKSAETIAQIQTQGKQGVAEIKATADIDKAAKTAKTAADRLALQDAWKKMDIAQKKEALQVLIAKNEQANKPTVIKATDAQGVDHSWQIKGGFAVDENGKMYAVGSSDWLEIMRNSPNMRPADEGEPGLIEKGLNWVGGLGKPAAAAGTTPAAGTAAPEPGAGTGTAGTTGTQGTVAPESLPVYTPQQAASLPKGTRFRGPDGKIRIKS